MSRRATTIEIAKRVGVSRSTVSNVLNSKSERRFSEGTRKKVMAMAERMGYRVDAMANVIKTPLKHLAFLGSGVASLRTEFMREMMSGIQGGARDYKYAILTDESEESYGKFVSIESFLKKWSETGDKFIKLVHSRIVHGLIVDNSHFGEDQYRLLTAAKVPFVLVSGRVVNRGMEDYKPFYERLVTIDHIEGGVKAVQHLLNHGHKRIALISPEIPKYPKGYLSHLFRERVQGYERALQRAGIENNPVMMLEGSLEDRKTVLSAVDKLLSLPDLPTAIFVSDDTMAVLVMNYLREKGFRIPADISVMGYGNLPVSYTSVPELTTVNVPWARMGQLSVEMLMSLLEGKGEDIATHQIVLETKIVEGGSVAAPSRMKQK